MTGTPFTRAVGIEVPVICGAMYPCSNPELVAAVSEAGGIGIVQPISLTYVHRYEFRAGLKHIRTLTQKPIGLNVLTEELSKSYIERNKKWVDIALEEGVRFFHHRARKSAMDRRPGERRGRDRVSRLHGAQMGGESAGGRRPGSHLREQPRGRASRNTIT
jgi:NAD(P)H-dependent flavin oxidoreductase YrpB (nitropropane dioxygenase family)